ncbi:MAG: glycosyltransferase [Pyrinomonadaceae bacterium]|nr:glycosyltransferase [Sphingobacteriaceae bacterium]
MINKIRICIITQAHLCRNPRVLKEAITLSKLGYELFILTSVYSRGLSRQDQFLIQNHNIKLVKVSDLTKKDKHSLIDRGLKKLGALLIKYLDFETSLALGYGSFRYYKICKSIKADLYICHQELATYIGNKLVKSGCKVAFDFEDWYSEDLLPDARNKRPVNLLRKAESKALNSGLFSITTSGALARVLSKTYSCKLPAVIYNAFQSNTHLPQKNKDFNTPLKLFWFSQTIGTGRGLEEFIQVLASVKNAVELHLLGAITLEYTEELRLLIPQQHQIHFHKLVEEQYLAEKIASFDIGLALEKTEPLSRNYTITNKFFQYLQAGLPVIASETAGQTEAFNTYKPGFMLNKNPAPSQAADFENWLNDPESLTIAQNRAKEAAHFYNWENESKKLIQLVSNHLNAC